MSLLAVFLVRARSLPSKGFAHPAPSGSRAAQIHSALDFAVFAVFAAHGGCLASMGTL